MCIRDSPKTLPTFYKYIHEGHFPSINDETVSYTHLDVYKRQVTDSTGILT